MDLAFHATTSVQKLARLTIKKYLLLTMPLMEAIHLLWPGTRVPSALLVTLAICNPKSYFYIFTHQPVEYISYNSTYLSYLPILTRFSEHKRMNNAV